MKKLLLTVSALAALSLLAPSTGFAYNNQVGFYSDTGYTSAQVDDHTSGQFNIYIVIHNPYNEVEDRVVADIGGFEFKLTVPGGGTTFILTQTYPIDEALNLGADGNYYVGFGAPVPVTEGGTLVLTLGMMSTSSAADQNYYLSAADNPSQAGEIVCMDFNGLAFWPIHTATGGDMAEPIFAVNPSAPIVAVDEISFDGVKALYR